MDDERRVESEKLTLNIGYVDLGKIDLLVREGYYSNRSDLIRTAIRNQLSKQSDDVERSLLRHTFDLGLRDISKAELEAMLVRGERMAIRVVGLARIASDVTPALALATIDSISVLGAFQASADVKTALAERIR
jgi:Arc/MetJ-type ribon-helix-helix transcriptional regulator